MTKMRGFAIRGVLKYVKHSDFPGGVPALAKGLSPDVAATYENEIQRGEWYPYPVYEEMLKAVCDRIGTGEPEFMAEVGLFTSQFEGNTMFELFSGQTTVERLLRNAAPLWQMYCDTGAFETEVGDGTLRAILRGFPDISPYHSNLLPGWIRGMGKAAGASSGTVTMQTIFSRGEDCCVYHATWK